MSFLDKIKQKIWHFVYKFFVVFQKPFRVFHSHGRQRYHIGWLKKGKTLEELKKRLNSKWGFGNHFVAWQDEGQVLSWRKLVNFNEQYRLRVFHDGEIRGHFEYTPESHPIAHLNEKDESFHKEEFLKFLEGFVTEERYISHLSIDPNINDPESEIILKP